MDIIYTRDLDLLVHKPWQPIMWALIKSLDDYYKNNNTKNKVYISYVKDKYWFLRCEYSWWSNYEHSLIEAVEDLSYYIKEDKNVYWKISWGALFDYYDRKAHALAVEIIWECVTASAEIKYFNETEKLEAGFEELDVIHTTKSSVVIEVLQEGVAKALFTFIKRK